MTEKKIKSMKIKCAECKGSVCSDKEDPKFEYHCWVVCEAKELHRHLIHYCCIVHVSKCYSQNCDANISYVNNTIDVDIDLKEEINRKIASEEFKKIKQSQVDEQEGWILKMSDEDFSNQLGKKLGLLEDYISFGFHECGFRVVENREEEWEVIKKLLAKHSKPSSRIKILKSLNISPFKF